MSRLNGLCITQLHDSVYTTLKENVSDLVELKHYMEDIINHGCASGLVPQLIYTKDCEYFVKDNLSDILILMEDMVEQGVIECMPTDISLIAWYSVEFIVSELYSSIDWKSMFDRTVEVTITEEEL